MKLGLSVGRAEAPAWCYQREPRSLMATSSFVTQLSTLFAFENCLRGAPRASLSRSINLESVIDDGFDHLDPLEFVHACMP